MKNVLFVLVIFQFLMLVYLLFQSNPSAKRLPVIIGEQIRSDTTFIIVPNPPIIIEKVKAKVKILRDTIIEQSPFIAQVDTVLLRDTVKLRYYFPEHLFSFETNRTADTIPQIAVTQYLKKEEEWWIKPVFTIAGAGLGYYLGKGDRK